MPHPSTGAPAPRNRLLRTLPPEDLATFWPQLEPVELAMEQKTHFLELPMPAIYFIESGLISMFATLENGNAAEVGLVGYEGMLGLPLLDDEFDDLKHTVVCPGTALHVSTAAFQEALEQLPNLRGLVDRYTLWCLTARWRQARPKLAAMVLLK